jgi:hypothetical protein
VAGLIPSESLPHINNQFFLKSSKIKKIDYDNEFDESGIVCLEGI